MNNQGRAKREDKTMDPRVPTHDLMTRVSKLNAEPEREEIIIF